MKIVGGGDLGFSRRFQKALRHCMHISTGHYRERQQVKSIEKREQGLHL
jgi:hypothetical protein